MIRIEAKTLEEAYKKASVELTCSVTQIKVEVLQRPSSGFLGMFKKSAIIKAQRESDVAKDSDKPKDSRKPKQEDISSQESKSKRSRSRKNRNKKPAANDKQQATQQTEKMDEVSQPKNSVKTERTKTQTTKAESKRAPRRTEVKKTEPRVEVSQAVPQIKEDINRLFSQSCFSLEEIQVEAYNENTVLIEFSGEDAALLIGKEGYRYKSLSYLLYNWINIRYNLNIRLEIAEFLKNQEEMIGKYLVGVIERINNTGRAQTKILDGVLVKIALEALRKEFPNKYVGIKTGRQGGKFIVINDFNKKSS